MWACGCHVQIPQTRPRPPPHGCVIWLLRCADLPSLALLNSQMTRLVTKSIDLLSTEAMLDGMIHQFKYTTRRLQRSRVKTTTDRHGHTKANMLNMLTKRGYCVSIMVPPLFNRTVFCHRMCHVDWFNQPTDQGRRQSNVFSVR